MDLGSLLKEKLGGAHGDADMSEEDAFDRLYDALKSGDRDEARDAFEHAVYEHQMALDDEDDEDLVDEDEEDGGGILLAMSPRKRAMTSDSRMKKPKGSGADFTETEQRMIDRHYRKKPKRTKRRRKGSSGFYKTEARDQRELDRLPKKYKYGADFTETEKQFLGKGK